VRTLEQKINRIGRLEESISATVSEIEKLRKEVKSEMLESKIETAEGKQYSALLFRTITDVINPVKAVQVLTAAEIKMAVTVSTTKVRAMLDDDVYQALVAGVVEKYCLKIKEVV
jgi:hypothetical protein